MDSMHENRVNTLAEILYAEWHTDPIYFASSDRRELCYHAVETVAHMVATNPAFAAKFRLIVETFVEWEAD